MSADASGVQKAESDFLQLELQAVLSYYVVLRNELELL